MDPVQRIWLFQHWLADQKEDAELAKNHAYLIGSFSNPEAVKNMLDAGNVHISSEEEFEESSKIVLESRNLSNLLDNNQDQQAKKRKRRSLKG